MLTYFWEQELIHYPDKEPVSWQEAIQESCLILLQNTLSIRVTSMRLSSVSKRLDLISSLLLK